MQTDDNKKVFLTCSTADVVKFLLVLLSVGILLCWGGCQYGRYSAEGADDNGSRMWQAREQLERAGASQQSITAGAERAAQSAGGIAGSIEQGAAAVDRADASAGSIEAQLSRSGEIIAESIAIIESVRAREERAAADAGPA